MARVKEFNLLYDDLQSFWCLLEDMGCKIPKKVKEECCSLKFFRDLDGQIVVSCFLEFHIISKVKSPSA